MSMPSLPDTWPKMLIWLAGFFVAISIAYIAIPKIISVVEYRQSVETKLVELERKHEALKLAVGLLEGRMTAEEGQRKRLNNTIKATRLLVCEHHVDRICPQ